LVQGDNNCEYISFAGQFIKHHLCGNFVNIEPRNSQCVHVTYANQRLKRDLQWLTVVMSVSLCFWDITTWLC